MNLFKIEICEELIQFMNENYPHLKIHEIYNIFENAEIETTRDWLSYNEYYESYKTISRINIKEDVARRFKIERNLPLITDSKGTAWKKKNLDQNNGY